MDTVNKKRQTDEIRRCAKDPIYFFNTYVRVSHPTKGPLPFKTYPFQDECVKAFIEHRFVIINKSRQLGLSTLAAAYAAWLLIFHRNKEVIIMATKLKIAMNFIRKVKFCVQNLPKWLVLPKIAEDNKQSLVFGFPSNSRIEAIPTAPDAGRSEALSLLIVDEAAHVSAFEELWKGLYPTLSCVAGDTKVLLNDGFYEIDELCSGHTIGDYFELTNDVYGKHGLERLSHGYVSPESETLKIKTRHGIELEVTKKHPLWVLNAKDGGSMVQAQNLKIGDHLRVQHSMNIYGNDITIDHHLVKEMTTELAYLLGGFIAKGWITRSIDGKGYTIYVSNSDAEFRDAFLNSSIIKKFHAQKNTQKLICCSRDLVTLFEAVGIDPTWKCDTKSVPKKIWRCPKEIQAAFLRGYFDGDGSATVGVPCASSTSRKLIADIHQLLLNIGIIPKIIASDLEKAKKQIGVRIIADNKKPLQSVRQSWGIHVPRSQAKLFLDKIGFAIKRKQEKLSSYVSMFECDDRKQHKVPLTKEILERIEVIVNESSHTKSWFRANGCRLPEKGLCELSTKKNYRENVRYTSVETIRRFRDFLFKNNIASEYSIKFLDEISGGDYYWDSIVSITESRAKTYDFTVPGTHSFLQNCILGSNTGGRAMIISTPNGVGNWFHKLWTDSQDKSNEFFSIELPWQVHPERDEEWFTNECKNMSQKAISQELLCDFLSSGDTYLDASDIEWVGKSIKPPLRRTGPDNNVWIWEEPIVDPDIKYIIPADVGRGDGNDFSTFHVLCVQTGQVVAEYRGKIRPDLFAKLLLEYGKKYNNALICPERNTYGHHVIIELVNNGYTNIYFRNRKNVYIGSYIPQDKISDAGFDTQKESRKQIVAKLEEVIRNKQIKVYSSRLYNELKTFVTQGDKPQAQKNCHDDLVMALAIGVWLFDASEVNSQFAQNLNKAMLSGFSMNSNSFDNLAGNGNEVLPSWIGMIPYMGGPAAPVNQKRLRPGPDSITNIDWLLKK